MSDELIEQANKANDMYCNLAEEMEYWKERCRLAEAKLDGIFDARQHVRVSKSTHEIFQSYNKFLTDNGKKPF